jgi:hypothetical protein
MCRNNQEKRYSLDYKCVLCHHRRLKGYPLKRTIGNNWAHVICAVWTPGISLSINSLDVLEGFGNVPDLCWNVPCSICSIEKGSCIKCSQRDCKLYAHISCSKSADWKLSIDGVQSRKLAITCPSHRRNKGRGDSSARDIQKQDLLGILQSKSSQDHGESMGNRKFASNKLSDLVHTQLSNLVFLS